MAAAAAIALPIAALFGPALLSDRMFAMRDAGHYYYPLFAWCAGEWGQGRVPLFNPHENFGQPILADPTSSVFYPGKLLFALPIEFALRFKLYVVGHVGLAAFGSYWMARRLGVSRWGAALAAISYACGGSVLFQHCNVVYLVGAAWLPVCLGLVARMMQGGRWWTALWLGAALAMIVLGGDPQMAYHVALAAALYAVISRFSKAEAKEPARRTFLGNAARLGIALGAAFALAAVQIVPSAEAATTSDRARYTLPRSIYEVVESRLSGGDRKTTPTQDSWTGIVGAPPPGTHHAAAFDFSIGPWRLIELVWPNIGGRMFPTHRRWLSLLPGEGRIWTPSLYMGLLPVGLAMFAIVRHDARLRHREADALRSPDVHRRWLVWLVVLFTLGSLGWYGLGWLTAEVRFWIAGHSAGELPVGPQVGGVYWLMTVLLPKYVYFRYPAKLFVVAACGISQLAALGLDRLLQTRRSRADRLWIGTLSAFAGLSAAGLLAALVAMRFVPIGFANADPAFGPFDSDGAWRDIASGLAQTTIVSLAALWLLGPASRLAGRSRRAGIVLLTAAELLWANAWLVPMAPTDLWRQPSGIAEALENRHKPPRVYRAPLGWPEEFERVSSASRMAEIVRFERATLAGRYGLLDDVAVVNSLAGLRSAEWRALLDEARAGQRGIPPRQWIEKTGVEYVIAKEDSRAKFARTVAADGLPMGIQLFNTEIDKGTGRETANRVVLAERASVTAAFRRGAWVSGVAWFGLAIAVVVSCRRRQVDRRPTSQIE